MLHASHRAMLHATLHVRAHPTTHLPRLRVGSGDRNAEAQRRDNTCCEFVRLFHGRFLSKVEICYLDRLPMPADSGSGSGLSKADSITKL
jgi:hypothetical protein